MPKVRKNGMNEKYIKPIERKIVRRKDGTYKKGTTINPEITNKYEDDKVFQHELKGLMYVLSGETLNFIEKGKMYKDFKDKYELSDKLVAEYFRKHRSTVSRCIRLYEKSLNIKGFDYDKMKTKTSDRVMMRALEIVDETQDLGYYFEKFSKYKNIGFSRMITILNGNKSIDDVIKEEKEKYEKVMSELQALKLELEAKK